MAARLNAAPAPFRGAWVVAEPGQGEHAAETHCNICHDSEQRSRIFAHRFTDKSLEIGHRVHEACLARCRDSSCPICRLNFEIPAPIPAPMGQRIVKIVSEGRRVVTEVFAAFVKLHTQSLFLTGLWIIQGTFFDLKRGLFPLFTANGFAVVNNATLGSLMTAAIVCVTTKISSYILSKMMGPIQGRANESRRFLFWAAKSLTSITCFSIARASFFRMEAHILAKLSPESVAIYSGLIGENYTCPDGLYKEALDAALLAHHQIRGLAFGMGSVFILHLLALLSDARRR